MEPKNSQPEALEAAELDLFGEPVRPIKDRRGRPTYGKTKENQDTVMVLRADGFTHAEIAEYIGCDEKTLRKHFSRELDHGALIVRAQCLEVLYTKARQGHRSSANDMLARTEKGRALPPPPKNEKPDAPEKLGKKAQADLDARNVPDGWGELLREPGQSVN